MVSPPQLPLLSHNALPFAHFEYTFAKTVTKIESSSDLMYSDLVLVSNITFFSYYRLCHVSGNSLEKDKKPYRNEVLLSLATSGCFQSTCVLARGPLYTQAAWDPAALQLCGAELHPNMVSNKLTEHRLQPKRAIG